LELVIIAMTTIYLVVMAIIDRRRKEIPVIPGFVILFFLIIAQLIKGTKWSFIFFGILVGVALYIVSKLSRGSIGEGDALVYMVTGVSVGFFRNFELLVLSLFFASMTGLFLLVTRKVGRKYAMPFIPFTAVAYGVVMML